VKGNEKRYRSNKFFWHLLASYLVRLREDQQPQSWLNCQLQVIDWK
jgi:hypothetical protein